MVQLQVVSFEGCTGYSFTIVTEEVETDALQHASEVYIVNTEHFDIEMTVTVRLFCPFRQILQILNMGSRVVSICQMIYESKTL